MKRYNKDSKEVKIGNDAELRLLSLLNDELSLDKIFIRRGMNNPSANGILGDILLSESEVDAPSVGIEVKSSTSKYVNTVCISEFELCNSKARWLAVTNEDASFGWRFFTMEDAKSNCEQKGNDSRVYYVVHHDKCKNITFRELIAEIRCLFPVK